MDDAGAVLASAVPFSIDEGDSGWRTNFVVRDRGGNPRLKAEWNGRIIVRMKVRANAYEEDKKRE